MDNNADHGCRSSAEEGEEQDICELLGSDAVRLAVATAEGRIAEVQKFASISESTDFAKKD